jgi:DNA-binding transcriptional ArsR family regulator
VIVQGPARLPCAGESPREPQKGPSGEPVLNPFDLLTYQLVSVNLPLVMTDQERDVWAALGDGTRRAIVLMLAAGPMSVGDLAAQLPVTRPAVSQHLKVLKDAGLVSEEAIGTRRIYRLDAAGVTALRAQLDDFWARALGGFQDAVERTRRGKK